MTVETLAAQLRQCREALDRCVAECSMRFDLLCAIGEATAFPVPSPESLATLARQAEIGALVERMGDGWTLTHEFGGNGGPWWNWTVDPHHDDHREMNMLLHGPTAIAALRAALNAADKGEGK